MKAIRGRKNMSVLLLVLICVIIGVFGQLFMKKGMNAIGIVELKDIFSTRIFSIVFQRYVFVGITLYLVASVIWLAVLSQAELSFAYPLIGLGYIFTALLGWFFFKENLTLFRFFGVLLIVGGVYLIALKV